MPDNTLPIDDVSGLNTSDVSSYSDYSQDHSFEHDLGVIVLPVASRTPRHRLIRLHGGVAMRRVKWSAARSGKPPIIPSATDLPLDTLISSEVHNALPVPRPQNGTYLFSLHGSYLYVQSTPRVAGVNALPSGAYPHTISPHDELAASLIEGVLDHTPVPTTVDEFDAAITLADNAARSGRGSTFTWPFTTIPSSFAATTLQ